MKLDVIYNKDCLEGMKRLPDKSINLIIADPPYNIKKASWDKIPDYINWSGKRIMEYQRVLKDNGSFYMFHNYMPTISKLMVWIEENTKFVFKQFIVWNKKFQGAKSEGYLQGYNEVEGLRNYQQMAEYILFYTFQDEDETGSKIFKPIKDYFLTEYSKAKLTLRKANKIMGLAVTGANLAGELFGTRRLRFMFPTKEKYKLLQTTGFFQRPYEDLRLEYENLRYIFNNQKTHHSVWNYEIAEKNGHLTPKPISLIESILRHSSSENDIVLIPFVGGGTDCMACRNLNRYYIGFEINSEYCEIAKQRLEKERTLWDK